MSEMNDGTRLNGMLATYGEVVKTATAAIILDCDRTTVYRMCLDGRLRKTACGKIDVKSIAEWIEGRT